MTDRIWYVDSSVVLRAIREQSIQTRAWFERASAERDRFVASRLAELEVTRVLRNGGLDHSIAAAYFDRFHLVPLIDALVDEALSLDVRLGAADAIHIATAMQLGPRVVTIATHDRQMAVAASELGFRVHDPVTDDPGRGPVV